MKHLASLAAAAAATLYASAAFAEKWDMPMAYPATNFHSENAAAFAACVGEGTGGNLEIVTHAGGSLFGGNDIKRAVQTGQAPIGERLLSAHANETRSTASIRSRSSPPPSTPPKSSGPRQRTS